MILAVKTNDTVLTSKGTTRIPAAIRRAAGLFPGSRIAWDSEGGKIRARRREGGTSEVLSVLVQGKMCYGGTCKVPL
jgi:bifunctional DNA-binding transcriptional regulator/antitoxin component of YhaV-PrlF toxin-antitoxin module